MRRFALVAAVLLATVALPLAASAQDNESIDAQMFRPSIFNGNFLAIEDAHLMDKMCYGLGLYVNYAASVVEVREDGEFKTGILNSVATANAVAAFSPWSWLAIGVDVPVHLQGRAKRFDEQDVDVDDPEAEAPQFEDNATLGDIKAELKLGLLREETIGIGFALAGFATFPTGDPEIFLGEGTTNFGGKGMLEKDFGFINIGLNAGYLVRPTRPVLGTDIGNAFLYGAGISHDWKSGFGFSIEYFGQAFDSENTEDLESNPMEALATLRYKFGGGLRVIGGGGAGLSDGVGSPSYRVLAGIDYFPECKGPTQGRLIVRVQTEDGLPVIATLKGKGPSGALAPKGSVAKPFEVKTDSTGTYNVKTDPGEYAVVALAPGYLPGSAKGTVLISKTTEVVITLALKKQPTTLQVNVVYKATGEPINNSALLIKNSATGKLEAKKLPTGTWSGEYAPGDYLLSGIAQGYERVDQPATVLPNKANTATLELRQIILQIGNIQFDYDSANIKVESYPILEDVLDKIRIKQAQTDTEIQKIIIEGHTSSEGTEEYNQNLSQRRAESVRNWLVEHGVAADLLDPRGYGESRPIADNETEEGRMKNRRVEFIFEETGGAGLSSPGAAGVEGGPTEVTGDTEPGQEPAAETPAPEGGEAAPEGGEAAPEGGEAAPEGGEAAPEGGETP